MGIRLKSCPKCQGDLFIEYSLDSNQGWTCLQCGWRCNNDKFLIQHEVLPDENGNMSKCQWKKPLSFDANVEKGEKK